MNRREPETWRIVPTIAIVFAVMLATAGGCKSVHWSKADFNSGAKAAAKEGNPFGTPVKMVAIWRDAVYESDRGPMSRGFGGRFYFYDEEQKPVRVKGELVVYAFDDSSRVNSSEADRKYVFRPEDLQQHYSETALGPSYSFWLPWDPVGGNSTSIALIPILKTEDGKIVKGNQSLNVLPGRSLDGTASRREPGRGHQATQGIATGWQPDRETARQVAYFDEEPRNVVTTGHEIRTTTINVSAETAARMAKSAGNGPSALQPANTGSAPAGRFESPPGSSAGQPQSRQTEATGEAPTAATAPERRRPESPWSAFRPLADVTNPSDKPPLQMNTGNKTR